MTDYTALSDDDQVAALRPAAGRAAAEFGLDVVGLELVAHAYNTTFAVDCADGSRWALRVGTNSASTPEHVVAQQEWLLAVASETDVVVPVPRPTTDGRWCTTVEVDGLDRPLLVTAASWLHGPDVGTVDAEVAHELGRVTALLHRQAATWRLPPGGELPRLVEPLFGDVDRLDEADVDASGRAVIDEARAATEEAFSRLHDAAALHVVHGDLHGGNLKRRPDGGLAVFDVDDCGLGLPVLDLGITTFYLREGDPGPEAALRAGYASVAPLPEVDPAAFEAVLAARQLLLANSVLASTTAELRAEAATYLPLSVARLRHWLETGVFSRTVPA